MIFLLLFILRIVVILGLLSSVNLEVTKWLFDPHLKCRRMTSFSKSWEAKSQWRPNGPNLRLNGKHSWPSLSYWLGETLNWFYVMNQPELKGFERVFLLIFQFDFYPKKSAANWSSSVALVQTKTNGQMSSEIATLWSWQVLVWGI